MSREAKWKQYSREELVVFVQESFSYRELAGKIGYAKDGGNAIATMKKMCEELNLDCSHFKG